MVCRILASGGSFSFSGLALIALVAFATLIPSLAGAQLGTCGTAGNYFQIDGQFYSTGNLIDWAQGATGQSVFDNAGNPIMTPALYDRDEHWAGNAVDPDAFSGSGNKNNDDISPGAEPWQWGPGSGPSKNDLTDVYAHSTFLNNDIWLFLGALTRSTNGASHIDFEFNQQGFNLVGDQNGLVVGNGAHFGRTANVDFIISVDFESGGNVPVVSCRIWTQVGSGYEFVDVPIDPSQVFVCTNNQTIPAPPWGAVAPDGDPATEVIPFQLVEIGVNLSGMGVDPSVFCSDASTLLFKTRSSPSFTAELKDLALYDFSIFPTPSCVITADQNPLCEGQQTTLCAPVQPDGVDYTYEWTGPGGPYGNTQCITTGLGGTYTLVVTDNAAGCASDTCSFTLTVNPLPVCSITEDTQTVCAGTSAEFCGPTAPAGTSYTYQWTGPQGALPNTRCIQVSAAGDYTLTVIDDNTGCVSASSCQKTLTVISLPVSSIEAVDMICQDSTATLCGPVGDYTYAWSGPDNSYPAERCITTGTAGTYSLVITSKQTGCVSVPATHSLVVAANPECSIEGADSICPDGEETLCGPEGEFTYSWEGPNGPYPDDRCITVEDEGTYTLTVENENGCISVCQHTLSLDEEVLATEPENLWLCTGETASFCVTPTGTGPLTYVWRHNGKVIDGESDNCCVIPSITAEDEGVYTVTISGKCSEITLSATLQLADVVVEELRGLYLCEGQEAEICPEVTGMGPYTFEWTRNGVVIGTDSCLVIEAVTEEDEGMYCVTVQGACGEPVTRCSRMLVGTCEEYCGLTQGFWGNYGGKWNGMTTLELMSSLITDRKPLVVGRPGRSITFPDGSEPCIIDLMPGGARSITLPEGLGDAVLDLVWCTTDPKFQDAPGRIRNNLLSQTIALSLNVRLDPDLPSMPLCHEIIMIGVDPGPDGKLGTEDDVPDNDDVRIVTIPDALFDALDTEGLPHNVEGLLDLANLGLAGMLPPEMNLGTITGAIGSVNNVIDRCAMIIHCALGSQEEETDETTDRDRFRTLEQDPDTASILRFGVRLLSPNPVRRLAGVRLELSLPEESTVKTAVFDISGRKVGEGSGQILPAGTHGIPMDLGNGGRLSSGIYFLRVESKGLETGEMKQMSRKLVILP